MDTSVIIIVIIVGVLLLLVFYAIGIYNKLVNARNKVDNQFSQIDIQLKRRADLIPNIVETVKGYAKHEKDTFKEVIDARNKAVSANSVNDKIVAENELSGALNKLFALTEAYPELKANENFLSLQAELSGIEDEIAQSRKYYNAVVREFNDKVEMIPSNIVAKTAGYKSKEMFIAEENEKKSVKVKL